MSWRGFLFECCVQELLIHSDTQSECQMFAPMSKLFACAQTWRERHQRRSCCRGEPGVRGTTENEGLPCCERSRGYRFGYYRLTLQKEDIVQKREQLKHLIEAAYANRIAHRKRSGWHI